MLSGSLVAAQSGTRARTPCESVSSMSKAYISYLPKATAARIPAQVAVDCLKPVPINKAEDLALIEEMKYYINWQSTLPYLLDPPKGYTGNRVDVFDEIERITKDLKSDKYKDEYSLMVDVERAFTKSYDFHFYFVPDIMRVFEFRRGNIGHGLDDDFAIVSVSKDGKELPKLFNYYDVKFAAQEGWTPSPIAEINNKSAEDYVQQWSTNYMFLKDHTRYRQ